MYNIRPKGQGFEILKPDLYTLLSGNNSYRSLTPLNSCRQDAINMNSVLLKLNFSHVVLSIDSIYQRMQRITEHFNELVENNDLVFIYYNGHSAGHQGKIAKGICLSKEGAFPFEDRLRSISLLLNLAKWFERIMAARIEAWCVEHGIQTEEQSGFMSHRRLQTRIISLVEELRLTVAACNGPALCLFIDFETAFDKLWYPALFMTLKDLEMPLSLRRWICDWLQNRSMYISYGGAVSRVFNVLVGAPQGSVLAALLFRLHIHFLPSYFMKAISHLFADDLTMIIQGALEKKLTKNIKYLEEQANSILKSLEKFADNCFLPVNVKKTKAISNTIINKIIVDDRLCTNCDHKIVKVLIASNIDRSPPITRKIYNYNATD
ncbi:unnamed protein product [Didymodactylos carnosus]|uniref:Reverse transcriptase domain-containing protein n=1 Tax=Didymodactylos carnosus TaxID=1234261 RepID=A0A814P7R1_9BILA|nr:unnamed protein product [Didymodactylos carnosus]CAF3865089.1 unnamed protein product [Didymodactylos carnosus]